MPGALARELYLATCGLPFVQQLEEIFPATRATPRAGDVRGGKPARCNAIEMSAETRRALEACGRAAYASPSRPTTAPENVEAFARMPIHFRLGAGLRRRARQRRPHLDAGVAVFSADRQEMLFVGDSLHDGEFAEREGVPFVGWRHLLPRAFHAALPAPPGDSRVSPPSPICSFRPSGRRCRVAHAGRVAGGGAGQPARVADRAAPKALIRSLASRCSSMRCALPRSGRERVVVVGGFGFPLVAAGRAARAAGTLVENPAFRDGNLVSLLCARPHSTRGDS